MRLVAYHARVDRSQPAELESSRPLTAEERHGAPAITRDALDALEGCIKARHVAEIGYTDAAGETSTVAFRPAYIRYNLAHHIVVWGMRATGDHWEQLRLDRIQSVADTGEPYTPGW